MSVPVIHAVLFDFDGTLAPNLDLPDMRRQVIALTRSAAVPERVFADCYIVEVIDAATAWLEGQDAQAAQAYFQAAHQLILDIELEAAQSTDPFPGIADKLDALRATGKRLGVVTRNCRDAVLQVFPSLMDHVDALHARDDTTHLKPDPRHLLTALQALDCAAADTAMVGDGALDMQAGRELNMFCVGVLSGSANAQALQAAGADQVIAHCLDLDL
jgi:phosphoglycolate phosphatase